MEEARALADAVYDELRALFAQNGIAPNERLPGENALAARFAVSRPVLRQALARLRAEGWIETRKGSGTIRRALPAPAPPVLSYGLLGSIPDIRAFMDFRCDLEGEMAARAARERQAPQLEALRTAFARLEAAIAAREPAIEEDIALHGAIAAASGNRFYGATLAALAPQTRFTIRLSRELCRQPLVARFEDNQQEHRAIVAAIEAGEPETARRAMVRHLQGGVRRLFGDAA